MERIVDFFVGLEAGYGWQGLALICAVIILFAVRMYYYLGVFARIPKYRNSKRAAGERQGGISVVVIVKDDFCFLEDTLPRIMAQQYEEFEVVIVDKGGSEEFSDELLALKDIYPNLVSTRLENDPRFPINDKMAYNVGIKAAGYDRVILTTSDARPQSDRWLACMAKGFSGGDVVIGYCGIEQAGGLAGKMMRCDRLACSMRYLSSAVRGRPFRGIIQNLGLTKQVYFANKGFSHLNMNIGEDDLFVSRIAVGGNTSVIINPHATMRQTAHGDLGWWWNRRKFYSAAYRFYPRRVRISTLAELSSRILFLLVCIVCLIWMPVEIKAGAATLLLIVFIVESHITRLIRRRLGEQGMGFAMLLYNIFAPFWESILALSRRFRPPAGVYR